MKWETKITQMAGVKFIQDKIIGNAEQILKTWGFNKDVFSTM